MDKSASYTVVQGTIITSTLTAFTTGAYGIITSQPNYGILAGAAALNSGFTAATFFGLREYVVSPLLVSTLPWPQYARRRGLRTGEPDNVEPSLSWTDRRTHKLLDSGLGGAATGGILRGWKSGRAAILPGALTAATICIGLQYAFNEADVARLAYVSRQLPKSEPSFANATLPPHHPIHAPEPSASLTEKIMQMLGIQKIAEEEYLEKLKQTRGSHLKRIAELEKQLEAEREDRRDR